MNRLASSYLQHRQNIGMHSNWQNKEHLNQEQQDKLIKSLASRPGLHSDNVQRQNMAHSIIQCVALLTSIRNCTIPAAVTQNTDIRVINELPKEVKVTNVSQETGSSDVFAVLTHPVTHLLERTDRFVAQYDPLRFPMAEAASPNQYLSTPVPISDFKKPEFISGRFIEFRSIRAFKPDGRFYGQNVKGQSPVVKYMRVSKEGKNYLIKESKPNEYYLFDPTSAKPHRKEVRVYFNANDNKVHLSTEFPKNNKFVTKTVNNMPSIDIGGISFRLHHNWDTNTPEIIKSNGEVDPNDPSVWHPAVPIYCPVRMDSDSKEWSLLPN